MQEDRGAAYRMAKEYDLNIQDAQKMLKQAREVPEIMKAHKKYRELLKEKGVDSCGEGGFKHGVSLATGK